MSKYTCPRCDYTNSHFSLFVKHLGRKKPCDLLQDGRKDVCGLDFALELKAAKGEKKRFPCDHCNNKYTSKGSLRVHIKRMHQQQHQHDVAATSGTTVTVAASMTAAAATIAMPTSAAAVASTATSRCRINLFGVEDVMHFFPDALEPHSDIVTVMSNPTTSMDRKFQDVVRLIYMDPKHPDNHTLSLDPITHTASVYTPRGFETTDPTEIIKKVKRLANLVMQHPLSFEDESTEVLKAIIGHDTFQELQEFTDRMDNLDMDHEFDSHTDELVWSSGMSNP